MGVASCMGGYVGQRREALRDDGDNEVGWRLALTEVHEEGTAVGLMGQGAVVHDVGYGMQ